jgi:hypothetical protein
MCKPISEPKQWALSAVLVLGTALIVAACGVLSVPSGRICETVNVAPDAGVEICGNQADLARLRELASKDQEP